MLRKLWRNKVKIGYYTGLYIIIADIIMCQIALIKYVFWG